jgi:DNA-binding transcriptional MerR regulator
MKLLTVKQVSKISGVSVRALHHYDEIGLLRPASIGRNGYRYYGRDELLRLQQILLHRELDIPLSNIRTILDDPKFDQLEALRSQRDKLAAEAKRYARLVQTIDRTIADLNGDDAMKNAELYKGISAEKQAEYEQWLIDRYGGDLPERIAASRKKFATMSKAEIDKVNVELHDIEQGLAEGLRRGVPIDSMSLDPMLVRHHSWIASAWDKECPPDAYSGLADLYLSHPDFVRRYEAIEPGFAEYLSGAMKAYAVRTAG